MNDLSRYISKRCENLLVEILDFLVQVMRHKSSNEMDAYHLGEAMGKVTLGPAVCDPIIAEKAGHFLTRMIIEHSKTIHGEKQLLFRVDSGFAWPTTISTKPMNKSEAARAKAKSYNRHIHHIHQRNFDPLEIADSALYSLLEDDFPPEPPSDEEPYISIFSKSLHPSDALLSPILYRLMTAACSPVEPVPKDPFANSYLFDKTPIDHQIRVAFDDFMPLIQSSPNNYNHELMTDKSANHHGKSHMKLINSSISHMKLMNLRKHNKNTTTGEEDTTIVYQDDTNLDAESNMYSDYSSSSSGHKPPSKVKNMMKRVIKIGTIAPTKKTIY